MKHIFKADVETAKAQRHLGRVEAWLHHPVILHSAAVLSCCFLRTQLEWEGFGVAYQNCQQMPNDQLPCQ